MIKKLVHRKVTLSEVAEPKPSRAASRVIQGALRRAHQDQQTVSDKASAIRSN